MKIVGICIVTLIGLIGFEGYMFVYLEPTLVNFLSVSLVEACVIILALLMVLVRIGNERYY